jgi:hypothetical protein
MALDYREVAESVKAELIELKERRSSLEMEKSEIDAKVHALVKTIKALAPMIGSDEEQKLLEFLAGLGDTSSGVGITDRIRAILRTTSAAQLSASEIKEELQLSGWDIAKYSNALSTIHTILKRLIESDEVVEVMTGDGRCFRSKKK